MDRRRRGCGEVGMPGLLRDFQAEWKSCFSFPRSAFSTALSPADSSRKFLRRPVSQAAVRALFVILPPSHCDPLPRLEQVPEPAHVQTLLPHPPVKTFHASVLHRMPPLNVYELDLLLDAPGQKMPARQLRPVV